MAEGRPLRLEDYSFRIEGYLAADIRALPAELLARSELLGKVLILFDRDSGRLIPGQEGRIEEARGLIGSIVELARGAGYEPRIEVIGHSAGAVADAESMRVSEERAGIRAKVEEGGVLAASLDAEAQEGRIEDQGPHPDDGGDARSLFPGRSRHAGLNPGWRGTRSPHPRPARGAV